MKYNIRIVLVLLFCIGLQAQNKSKLAPQLYLSLSEYGPRMENFIAENNITKMGYVNDAQFMGKEPYTFDPKLLKKQVEIAVPNPNSKGIVYIDIEGANLDNIMNLGTQIDSFKKSIKLYIDVIKYAKKLRPNIQWGYYYIPYITYWNRTPEFYGKLKKIEPLIKECDVFFPSLYIFYEEKDKNVFLENEKYVIENTKEMIKAGQYYNKPVVIFVWHRYHPSNNKLGMESLPEKVFLTHIERIVNTTYEGKKVDGIVWWGADDYFFRQKTKGVIKEFKGTDKEFVDYNDKVMLNKAKKVKAILDSSN